MEDSNENSNNNKNVWWETIHHHTVKIVSDQHQWCCSDIMLPMMNILPQYAPTDDEYAPTIQLYWSSDLTPCCWDTSKKTVEGLFWQHLSTMKDGKRIPNSTIYIYNKLKSFSFFISITIIYLVFIRIREPSCDFVNYLMKFTNWRERKNRPVFERLI